MKNIIKFLLGTLLFFSPFISSADLYLRDNLQKATTGDFIVTAQNKTYTVLLVSKKSGNILNIEEISIPAQRKKRNESWRQWVTSGAPCHTSWVMYQINLGTGKMEKFYSFDKKGWFEIREAENFLSKLLNLRMTKIPPHKMKRTGSTMHGKGRIWQPKMIFDGQVIPDVKFEAFRTRWPSDGSELSKKVIEVYLPDEMSGYTSYFPYWLQIKGVIGKAKVRIVDSGINLQSPYSSK
jgi:hypothetical protein